MTRILEARDTTQPNLLRPKPSRFFLSKEKSSRSQSQRVSEFRGRPSLISIGANSGLGSGNLSKNRLFTVLLLVYVEGMPLRLVWKKHSRLTLWTVALIFLSPVAIVLWLCWHATHPRYSLGDLLDRGRSTRFRGEIDR